MFLLTATPAYLVDAIERAIADAETSRLVADYGRATASMYEAFGLHAALLRLERRASRGKSDRR